LKKCYLLILIIGLIICNSMFSLDMNESFGFNLVKDLDKNTLAFYKKKEIKLESKTKPLGYIYYSAITKSLSAGNESDDGRYLEMVNYDIEKNELIFTVLSSQNEICGENNIWKNWDYPIKYTIKIDSKSLKKIEKEFSKRVYYNYNIKKAVQTPAACNALIITDNLRVRSEPNLAASTKIIGKFNKWDDVHLIDCTKEKTKIDGLEYPWYKVQLENGQEGWIFGGFAKIYFSARDKDYLYKAFEKEGSEYTNQFVTPEEFY